MNSLAMFYETCSAAMLLLFFSVCFFYSHVDEPSFFSEAGSQQLGGIHEF